MNRFEAELDELGLMALHVAALFTTDARGRIVGSNEPDPARAPRLFLGVTELGLAPYYRDDLPEATARKIERHFASITVRPAPHELPATILPVIKLLEKHGPVTEMDQGPAWRFPAEIPAPEGVTAIGPENVDVLRAHYSYTADHLDELSPVFAMVEQGSAVSACFSSRNTAIAAEAGVDTEEPYRGRGYAPRVVAAWARAVRDQGRIPLYSADGQNAASRAVARKLGLIMYGFDVSIS